MSARCCLFGAVLGSTVAACGDDGPGTASSDSTGTGEPAATTTGEVVSDPFTTSPQPTDSASDSSSSADSSGGGSSSDSGSDSSSGDSSGSDSSDSGSSDSGSSDSSSSGDDTTGVADHSLRIFITSTASDGNYGSPADADIICDNLAMAAGLGGTWSAWLSSPGEHASARIDTSGAPYTLVDGTVIAEDIDALLDGTVEAPINLDENGLVVLADVWTGTLADGTAAGADCSGWTTSAGVGRCGASYLSDSRWSDNVTPGCLTTLHLYCIENS